MSSVAALGMTTMVANATRVAAVAEDATRLLGLRSPGERSGDVTATKRRAAQLSPGRIGKPVRNQVLSTAVAPGSEFGAGNPLTTLLDLPGFVAPGLVAMPGPSAASGGEDVAFAYLPPPAFTPGGIVFIGGGEITGGSAGGGAGGGTTTSTGGDTTTSTGGTSTTSGGTTSTGGTASTSSGGNSSTSGGGGSTSTGGTTSSSGGPNVPAVPEPSTWLMMLAGFAAIGTAMRRTVRHAPVRGA